MPHIAIVVHRDETIDEMEYCMKGIADLWRQAGLRVSVLRGPQERVEADLAILHVNRTFVPRDYLDFVQKHPRHINGHVGDISKRRVSRQLVQRGDGHEGPVIVKTNLNHFGRREAKLARLRAERRGWIGAIARALRPGDFVQPMEEYQIYPSPPEVPPRIWRDHKLVVERFLPERLGELYALRTWIFLGDRQTHAIVYATEPFVKSNNVVRREVLGNIPDELMRMRRELHFDFGKFDYAIVDGRVILYDANRTPVNGAFPDEVTVPRLRTLAEGIHVFFER